MPLHPGRFSLLIPNPRCRHLFSAVCGSRFLKTLPFTSLPRLDVSTTSIHTKRRIWQESITALMLTDPQSQIPKEQSMAFAQARDSEFPPYLLDFRGTPGERHVENLKVRMSPLFSFLFCLRLALPAKIYREVGSASYTHSAAIVSGPNFAWHRHLEDVIQKNYIGPDCYWKRTSGKNIDCMSHFGNAWWIPFPPSLVRHFFLFLAPL